MLSPGIFIPLTPLDPIYSFYETYTREITHLGPSWDHKAGRLIIPPPQRSLQGAPMPLRDNLHRPTRDGERKSNSLKTKAKRKGAKEKLCEWGVEADK